LYGQIWWKYRETQCLFPYRAESITFFAINPSVVLGTFLQNHLIQSREKILRNQHELYRSKRSGLFARRKGILHAKDVKTSTEKQTKLQRDLAKKDRELKRKEREIENLNRKVATQRGRLADALAIGLLPADVDLPISLENDSRLNYGADGLVIDIDEKERQLHLHFIETNFSSGKGEPELTRVQKNIRFLIKKQRVICHFHNWYVDVGMNLVFE
jgi:hypothetical protein